jgi:hypothetical protein
MESLSPLVQTSIHQTFRDKGRCYIEDGNPKLFLERIIALKKPEPCQTCNDNPYICAEVPSLRHCDKATRGDKPCSDLLYNPPVREE